jgi:hypothetical protein
MTTKEHRDSAWETILLGLRVGTPDAIELAKTTFQNECDYSYEMGKFDGRIDGLETFKRFSNEG